MANWGSSPTGTRRPPAPTAAPVAPAMPQPSPAPLQPMNPDVAPSGPGQRVMHNRGPSSSGLTNIFNDMLLSDRPTADKFGGEIRQQGQNLMNMGIGPDERARADQAALATQIGQYASEIGQGPSLAAAQQQAGLEQLLRSQMAMAAGAGGANAALARRQAMTSGADAGVGVIGQQGMLRAQEAAQNEQLRMQAYGLQGGIQNALRGGDIQQQGLAQQQLMGLLAQQLGREQLGQQYFGQGLQVNRDVLNALTGREAARLQDDASKRAANAQQNAALIGAIGSGAAAAIGAPQPGAAAGIGAL